MPKKIVLAVVFLVIVVGGGLYLFANHQTQKQLDRIISQAIANGGYQVITYESVDFHFNGDISLTNLRVVDQLNQEYIIGEVVFSDYDYLHEIPWQVTMQARDLSFPGGLPAIVNTENETLNQYLSALVEEGIIPISFDYHYDYDPDENDLIQSTMSFGLDNAANFSVSSSVKNIALEEFFDNGNTSPELTQMRLLGFLATAAVPHASFVLKDLGVIDALLEISAEDSGSSPEDIRRQMISLVQSLYLFAPQPLQNLAIQISNEFARFLEGGKTFSVSMEPEFEGSIQQLQPQIMSAVFSQDYNRIIGLLNLKFTTQ